MNKESLSNAIWEACDIMRRDDGTSGVMEYMEQLSWMLFLKWLDAYQEDEETTARLGDREPVPLLEEKHRWRTWAKADWSGQGQEIVKYVDTELFPYLRELRGSTERDIIRTIFTELPGNRMKSPYNLRDVIAIVDQIDFLNTDDIHTVSHIYEDLLRKLGSENRLAGEFYTPRPVIRFIVDVVDPKIGETVYDPACGSCGFLVEAYNHMTKGRTPTVAQHEMLQRNTFFGQEKKPFPYLLGLMNMVLHGIFTDKVVRKNTLEEDIRSIPPAERFDVILTNPPFGGKENKQVQRNFPVQANATELLFLQHIMKKLKAVEGARCGMVVPEGILFRSGAFAEVKKSLLEDFNLWMIVSLPTGTFAPYSDVKTALLFFRRPGPTREIWYYELPVPEGLKKFSKGKSIADEHFAEVRQLYPERKTSERSWIVTIDEIKERDYDLSARNPNRAEVEEYPPPVELLSALITKHKEAESILADLKSALEKSGGEV